MEYRKLGKAGIKLSEIGLGGWVTYGGSIQDQAVVRKIILAAYENGIRFFDTADKYSYGKSEEMMGRVFQELTRHTLVISSKVWGPMSEDVNDRGLSRKHIMESIDKTLRRLGTDYLDIYFSHNVDADTPIEETVRAMDDLIHLGKVLYWGISKWSRAQTTEAAGIARANNLYPPSVHQPGYNLLRRENVENEILSAVRPLGIGLTTFSPLSSGRLTGKYDDGIPPDSRAGQSEGMAKAITEDMVNRVKQLKPMADDLGITRSQLGIAWILRHPEVTSVITGATKHEQTIENAKASGVKLSRDVVEKMNEMFPL